MIMYPTTGTLTSGCRQVISQAQHDIMHDYNEKQVQHIHKTIYRSYPELLSHYNGVSRATTHRYTYRLTPNREPEAYHHYKLHAIARVLLANPRSNSLIRPDLASMLLQSIYTTLMLLRHTPLSHIITNLN